MPGGAGDDSRYMLRALELAERGWGRVAPNPMVGAVVVRDGEVVGEGWHREYGAEHAEVAALREAGDRARGATLYVTLEPCAHHGKTPPCADAVVAAGVSRLVYAAADPNSVARGGAERVAAAGTEVVAGIEQQRALDLDPAFFHRYDPHAAGRPWVELKLALSLDGKIADRDGRSAWITSEDARAEVHRLRAGHDAVVVGIGTVLADDPLLTVRGAVQPRVPPVRVVLDRTLRLPVGSRLVATARDAALWVLCDPGADPATMGRLADLGVRVLPAGDLLQALRVLRAEKVGSLLVEGGARIASALLSAGLVDRMSLFYAPVLLGPEGAPAFGAVGSPALAEAGRWRHLGSRVFGPDTLITLGR